MSLPTMLKAPAGWVLLLSLSVAVSACGSEGPGQGTDGTPQNQDRTGPSITISPATLNLDSRQSAAVSVTATDLSGLASGPDMTCDNGGVYSDGSFTAPVTDTDLIVTCTATASDTVGNQSTSTLTANIIGVDEDAPVLTFSPSTLNLDSGLGVGLTVTASDNIAVTNGPSVACDNGASLEGEIFTAPVTETDLTVTCVATASDAAENEGTATLTANITGIDITAPSVTLSPSVLNLDSGASAALAVSAADSVAVTSGPSLSCDNGASYQGGIFTAPLTATDLTVTCTASAGDAAGNIGTDTLTANITGIDITAPELTFSPAVLNLDSGQAAGLTVNASDNIAVTNGPSVTCDNGASLEGGTFTAPLTETDLTVTCTAAASDAAGNQGTNTLTANITGVDVTPPSVEISPSALSLTSGSSAALSVSATDSVAVTSGPSVACDNGASFEGGVFTAPETADDLTVTCTAIASDAADNEGAASIDITVIGLSPNLETGTILVNQHGYVTDGIKTAALPLADQTPLPWHLIGPDGQVLMSGETAYFGTDGLYENAVHQIDFSDHDINAAGLFLIAGDNASHRFDIAPRPYTELFVDSLKYFYQSRAGEPVEAAYVPEQTPALSRPAGHVGESLTCFTGTDFNGTNWPSCNYSLDIQGGWYDAGDYGLYAVNTGITAWTLLNLYETNSGEGNSCTAAGATANLNIPESSNAVNDLLDEARIGLELLMSLQVTSPEPVSVPVGAQEEGAALTLTSQSVTGMVHHKIHGAAWPGDSDSPAEDVQTRYLYPPSTIATLHLAGAGAQCARIWQDIDPAFSARCLSAAITAWEAANANPDIYAYDNFDGGGPYSDLEARDEFAWAATELFLTTDEAQYETALLAATPNGFASHGRVTPNWRNMEPMALMSMAAQTIKDANKPQTQHDVEMQAALSLLSDQYLEQIEATGYKVPDDDTNYYWGSNSNLLYRAMVMGTAYDLTQNPAYQTGPAHVMNYLLGHNPMGTSYITEYGEEFPQNIRNYFWSNSIDAASPRSPAGLLSGGPNNTAMVDPVASAMEGTCSAQTCWADDFAAWSLNEISLSWNASLAWTTGWLDHKALSCGG